MKIRKHFCAVQVPDYRKRLQIDCGADSLEIFRSHVDMVLGTLFWVSLLEQGFDWLSTKGPLQSEPFCGCSNAGIYLSSVLTYLIHFTVFFGIFLEKKINPRSVCELSSSVEMDYDSF